MTNKIVGIDLGTTFSAIAVLDSSGNPEILPDLNAGFVLDDQSVCQIISAIDLPETLVLNASEAITNSVTVQWQRSDNQYRWSDISGQRSANLTFNLGDSWLPTMPVTYYRAIITYVGDPQPSNLEQTSIRFNNNPAIAKLNINEKPTYPKYKIGG